MDVLDWITVACSVGSILLDEQGLAEMLSVPRAAVRKLVLAGHLPRARDIGLGIMRWHAEEVRQRVGKLFSQDGVAARAREASRAAAEEALNEWTPAVRGSREGKGKGLPVLPQGRPARSASRP